MDQRSFLLGSVMLPFSKAHIRQMLFLILLVGCGIRHVCIYFLIQSVSTERALMMCHDCAKGWVMTCKEVLTAQLSELEGFRFLHGQASLKAHEVFCLCHFPSCRQLSACLAYFVFCCGVKNHHKLCNFKQHKLPISK